MPSSEHSLSLPRLSSSLAFSPQRRRIVPDCVHTSLSSRNHPLPLLLLIAALLLALRAPAQEIQQDISAATGYSVRGTVVNAIGGQPIARALVSLSGNYATLTGSGGEFSFDNVPAGDASVSVMKPDYQGLGGPTGMAFLVKIGGRHFPQIPPRQIEVGPDMPTLTLRITPLAMISGHVTLSTADPADGIRIQVFSRQFQNGRATWSPEGEATTRSDGSFRIPDLSPGSYMLATQASLDRPGYAGRGSGAVWGYPSLYYPGVTDVASAGIITLTAGQQGEADLTLTRQQFFPVTALVRSASDSTVNFDILNSGGQSTGLPESFNRRKGIVRADIPNGTWAMEAHAYGRTAEWGRTDFQVNGAPVSFAISILPVPKIPVIIHREFATNSDASGASIIDSGPGMNLFLVPADGLALGRSGGSMNQEGDAQWLNINQPGHYWVEAQAFPPTYISSITSGGADLASSPLVVIPGSDPMPIEVTLRNDPGTITGQISGQGAATFGTPGEQAHVWLYAIPLFPTAGNLPEGSMQASGQFTIPNLAPGSYRVVACDAPQEIDFHSTEGLAAWAAKGQTITVDPGGTASVELEVLHTTATAQ